jgi:hypothetical protein
MPPIVLIVIDLVAIAVLAGAVYFPRHRRRDMVLPYVGLNVGVLGVTLALSTSSIGVGLGLGLFGVLSIIRLRSSELTQAEVAYYFVSLAMGLLGGLSFEPAWAGPTLIWMLVAVVFIADHPRVLARYRNHVMRLDAAYTDERALVERLEQLLNASVRHVVVLEVDLVNDTTRVDVRYQLRQSERPLGEPTRWRRDEAATLPAEAVR